MAGLFGDVGKFFVGEQRSSHDTTLNPIAPYAARRYQKPFFQQFSSQVFPQLQALGARRSGAALDAAGSAGWGQAAANAERTISGARLAANPYLEKMLATGRTSLNTDLANTRAATGADLAGQNAAIQSQYARNGLGFSTANQQAAQANTAAALARVGEAETSARAGQTAQEAQARLQNYLSERAAQERAPGQLSEAQSAPLNYLSTAEGAVMQPNSEYAAMLKGLWGGGPNNLETHNYGGVFPNGV